MAVQSCIESEGEARMGLKLTLTWWSSSTAATAVEIAVDGDGVLRRRRTGDDGEVRRRGRRQQRGAGTSGVEKFQPFGPRDIYTRTLSVAPS